MPYVNEFASKASHFDIVKNPEVAAFLGAACERRLNMDFRAGWVRASSGMRVFFSLRVYLCGQE